MSNSSSSAPFKLSLGNKGTAKISNGNVRSHSAFLDDTDGHEDGEHKEQISTFDPSVSEKKSAPVKVISGIPDRDWREESRRKRQKSGIPQEGRVQAQEDVPEIVTNEKPAYGLTFVPREATEANTDEKATGAESAQDSNEQSIKSIPTPIPKPKSADEEALDALLGNGPLSNNAIIAPPSPSDGEDEAFRSDFRSAPPPTTAEQYAATPVEGFGAAILRGYLNAGETLEDRIEGHAKRLKANRKSKENTTKKRPGQLGIGAKESGLGIELGAWGKAARRGPGQNEPTYNPLVRRNRETGETLTEEEYQKRLDMQKEEASWAASSVRNGDRDNKDERSVERVDKRDGGKESDRERRRNDDRHRSSRRDRSRSTDDRHRQRKSENYDRSYPGSGDREQRKREKEHNYYHDSRNSSSRRDDKDRERRDDRRDRERDRRR